MKAVSPVDVTPTLDGTWNDVDVTAHVGSDAGSVALVVVEVVDEGSSSDSLWGIRKNGSTDTIDGEFYRFESEHTVVGIGVDSNDIFEFKAESGDNFKVYLIGYATTAEAGNLTNATDQWDQFPDTDDTWLDVDIASDTGDDTAKYAFFLYSLSESDSVGIRPNGSTDDYHNVLDITGEDHQHGMSVGLDANEVCEFRHANLYSSGNPNGALYLTCWLFDNVTVFSNGIDYSEGSTTDSYVDVDFSSDIPDGNLGALYLGLVAGTEDFVIRSNGETFDPAGKESRQTRGWTGIDSSRVAEQRIDSTDVDLYLYGYTSEPSGGTAHEESFASTTTPAGAVTKSVAKAASSSGTPSGALARVVAKAVASTTTPAGTLARAASKTLASTTATAGALATSLVRFLEVASTTAPAGAVVFHARKTLAGTTASAGVVVRSVSKSLASATTPAGAIAKAVSNALASTTAAAGALANQTQKALASSTTPAGTVDTVAVLAIALAATVSSAGALVREAQKGVSGAVMSSGAVAQAVSKAVVGVVASAGALSKVLPGLSLAGTVASSGALVAALVTVFDRVEAGLSRTGATVGQLARRAGTNFRSSRRGGPEV